MGVNEESKLWLSNILCWFITVIQIVLFNYKNWIFEQSIFLNNQSWSCIHNIHCLLMCFQIYPRGLKNILRMYVKKVNCSEWELIPVPSRYGSNFIIFFILLFPFSCFNGCNCWHWIAMTCTFVLLCYYFR